MLESGGFDVPAPDTEFNRKKAQQSMDDRRISINTNLVALKRSLIKYPKTLDPLAMMDTLERVISTCGGEKKLVFLEVTSTFVRAMTRVPITFNLFPFLDEGESNPRFHTVVTKILMDTEFVTGVRSMPVEDGVVIMVNFRSCTE